MRAKTQILDSNIIEPGNAQEVLNGWTRAVMRNSGDRFPARDVYKGRAFFEARRAADLVGGDLRIVSAGLGLLKSNDYIPVYDISITGGGNNNVRKKVRGILLERDWWAGINRDIKGDEKPISSMVVQSTSRLFVFALSSAYYRLIEGDLLAIPHHKRMGLRLLGLGLEKVVHQQLSEYLLPFDEHFDGPDSPIRGTRSDFAQRAARHLISELVTRGITDLEEQKRQISQWMKKWRGPGRPKREAMRDEEILSFLRDTAKKVPKGGCTRMLRTLRDIGYRCEQRRFAALYRRALAGGDERTSR